MSKKAYAEGDVERIKQRYNDPNIEWCDEYPPVDGKYDLVVLDHFLQTGAIDESKKALVFYVQKLAPGGKLIIIVPSLEWCAAEIATKDVWPYSVYLGLYGTLKEQNRSGYTLSGLRTIMERIPGLEITAAETEAYVVNINNQQEVARQNVVTAVRVDAPQAADAIA